jgi:GNAT superfamily N-acetyltransferase
MPLSAPEPLAPDHDLAAFSCGRIALDNWLRTRARSNQDKGFSVVVVVHEDRRVVGFYALAPTAISPSVVPRSVRTGQPPDPLPCLLLGQLAVDLAWAGRGIGAGLVAHAFTRAAIGARLVGGRALLVHASDEAAAAFWRRHGFTPARDTPHTLFRSMADLVASVADAG